MTIAVSGMSYFLTSGLSPKLKADFLNDFQRYQKDVSFTTRGNRFVAVSHDPPGNAYQGVPPEEFAKLAYRYRVPFIMLPFSERKEPDKSLDSLFDGVRPFTNRLIGVG